MDKIVNKIVNIIKEAKAPVDPKLISWIEKRYGPWNDKDFISDDGDTYFKYEKTSPGGGLSHTIVRLPSFGELIKQLKDSRDAANDLIRGESVRDDEVLRAIYDQQKDTYNKFRTHLRKEYPAFYSQLKGQLTEEEIDEMSVSGAAGGFLTPYAFRKPKKKQEPIPENLNEDINLNAYGYKLVPKDKDGNYVQKGSKLDVVNLFEDQKEYQAKRIAAFSTIEQEMNDIYKMLSNAKNETSEYYNDNPSSYTVVKPTDLVLDYIKDIKDLLKGE
mgnify:FL=1|tara:strand:+ start:53 stop:871 length:819 start_codon:yes stop_codon:yes gene_type:complete